MRGGAAERSAQRGTSGAATGGGGRSAPDPAELTLLPFSMGRGLPRPVPNWRDRSVLGVGRFFLLEFQVAVWAAHFYLFVLHVVCVAGEATPTARAGDPQGAAHVQFIRKPRRASVRVTDGDPG